MFVAVLWTSMGFHAFRIEADCRVGAERRSASGTNAVAPGTFPAALAQEIGDWLPDATAVLLSGMVTSRTGWVETTYAPTPAGLEDLADGAVRRQVEGLPPLFFLPGVAKSGPLPDMMRGEEIGLLGAAPGDGLVVLPGQHSKWLRLADSRIVDIRTYLSGEIGRLLKHDSILAKMLRPAERRDPETFLQGVRSAIAGDSRILGRLFSTRSLVLFDHLSPQTATSYLDGLLVGAEIGEALAGTAAPTKITLIGTEPDALPYQQALMEFGISADTIPAHPARGFLAIATALGLAHP